MNARQFHKLLKHHSHRRAGVALLLAALLTVSALAAQTGYAQGKSAQAQAKLDLHRQELILAYAGHVVSRLNDALDRLQNISDRIGTRLDKLAAEGGTISGLRDSLAQANGKIADARTAVAAITAQTQTLVGSGTPKTEFPKVRTTVQSAADLVKSAHAALVNIVNSIHPGLIMPDASSTERSATSTN